MSDLPNTDHTKKQSTSGGLRPPTTLLGNRPSGDGRVWPGLAGFGRVWPGLAWVGLVLAWVGLMLARYWLGIGWVLVEYWLGIG